jgi:hypothetical protein
MTSVDSLMLDAKQAILDEHRRRFQVFHQEGRVHEAIHQFHVTVNCANDILSDSLHLLEEAIAKHDAAMGRLPAPPA